MGSASMRMSSYHLSAAPLLAKQGRGPQLVALGSGCSQLAEPQQAFGQAYSGLGPSVAVPTLAMLFDTSMLLVPVAVFLPLLLQPNPAKRWRRRGLPWFLPSTATWFGINSTRRDRTLSLGLRYCAKSPGARKTAAARQRMRRRRCMTGVSFLADYKCIGNKAHTSHGKPDGDGSCLRRLRT